MCHRAVQAAAPAAAAAAAAPPAPRAAEAIQSYLRRGASLPAALVRPARFAAISRIMAAAGPDLPRRDQELLADVFLFIFALDDLIDEGGLSDEEVELRLDQYRACAALAPRPEIAFDPVARCLRGLAERLRRARLGAALFPAWVRRVEDMLEGMRFERRVAAALRAGAPAPTLERYLEHGRHSVAIAFFAMSAWMLIGEAAAPGALPLLERAERHLSLAARLANDLRSHERELGEGAINALSIVGPDGAGALRARAQEELAAGRAVLAGGAAARAGVARSAAYLEGFAAAVVDLYETRDFHTA